MSSGIVQGRRAGTGQAIDSVLDGATERLAVSAAVSGTIDPADDYDTFEAQHITLVASTDTTITFTEAVRAVRISNWDINSRVLVKDGAIATDSDASSARVGKAPAADVPGSAWFPFATTTIHLRSTGANEITVEGYKGSV
jgi:hypothetical protein